jgi:hypothetical protein
MNNSQFKFLEVFNLKKLSEITDVSYAKLYFRKIGETKEAVSPKDATKIANGIKKGLDPLFKKLGFVMEINRSDSPPA